jgi:hypothetical protein
MTTPQNLLSPPTIPSDEALRVARLDAERMYRDLHLCRISIRLEADGWHVDFDFKDDTAQSGAPHYVIDASNGRVVWKRYEQ